LDIIEDADIRNLILGLVDLNTAKRIKAFHEAVFPEWFQSIINFGGLHPFDEKGI
jgi:hypothetical protein